MSLMEFIITGMDDSSCKRAPETGLRIAGTVSITATAKTARKKTRICFMVLIALGEKATRKLVMAKMNSAEQIFSG